MELFGKTKEKLRKTYKKKRSKGGYTTRGLGKLKKNECKAKKTSRSKGGYTTAG